MASGVGNHTFLGSVGIGIIDKVTTTPSSTLPFFGET